MMSKKKLHVHIFCLILIYILNSFTFSHGNQTEKKVLLLYDQRVPFGRYEDFVTSYGELLGHFNTMITEQRINEYKSKELNDYDYIVLVNIDGSLKNSALLNDLKYTHKRILWMGKGIEIFLKDHPNLSLEYKGQFYDFLKVKYINHNANFDEFIENNEQLKEYTIIDGNSSDTKVYAYLYDQGREFPYMLKEKNFFFVSRMEIDSKLFFIIADVLYDFFEEYSFEESQVYIRLEDVHPFRDTNKLIAVGEYLYEKRIPFMIALIPAYKNPKSGFITFMSDHKEFVNTIKYLQDLGGTVVLHGFTHESFGGETSGEGFEFWNDMNDQPLNLDMKEWIHSRIGKGILECIQNDIYPLAFELPHYAISQKGYFHLKNYFSTHVGQLQTSDIAFNTVGFPYALYNTKRFHKFIPENLGYVNPNNPLAINMIFNNFEKLSMVRGFTGGVFFHPYLDIKYLKEIVTEFENKNVKFYDLKKEYNWVQWEDISIVSKEGRITVDAKNYISDKKPKNNLFRIGTHLLIYIVLIFCIVLFIIFLFSRKRNTKNLFR